MGSFLYIRFNSYPKLVPSDIHIVDSTPGDTLYDRYGICYIFDARHWVYLEQVDPLFMEDLIRYNYWLQSHTAANYVRYMS